MRDDTLSFAKTASGGPPAARPTSAAATGSPRRTSPLNWPSASQAVMGEKRPPVAERPPAVRP